MPQDKRDWRGGSTFYRYTASTTGATLGYRGPEFGLTAMPDQYGFCALQRLELARAHRRPCSPRWT